MKKTLLIALSLGVAVGAASTSALAVDPEMDRQQVLNFFTAKNPKIAHKEYINGAYIYDADKKAQWEAAEEFPPYLDDIDAGEAEWNKHQTIYEKCFGSDVSKVRVKYPYFDDAANKVVTLEGSINKCRTDAGLKAYKTGKGKLAQVSAYLGYNARGQIINVKIESEGARKAYEAGRAVFTQVRGQLGLSCAKCHAYNAGRKARSNIMSPFLGHPTHFPVYRAKSQSLHTLEGRYVGCMKNMRATPFKPQSAEFKNLEFFEAYVSNGLEINAPGYRE
ncbi:sulfur oxidation c-type cytochrome SoxA [Thiomicrorhabdus sp. Milos-T2]|uniref:sulfur oxidation c-type cytochrome SoxA n=1 Tax=Thiomicrorhabdus sp. Milos-T2 TaxID=90814 RepID=UPI000493E69C|nr:sulfur oxidation c-type cytochrome SoxA [Thiomicrorhabdus sp. Milos-T2]